MEMSNTPGSYTERFFRQVAEIALALDCGAIDRWLRVWRLRAADGCLVGVGGSAGLAPTRRFPQGGWHRAYACDNVAEPRADQRWGWPMCLRLAPAERRPMCYLVLPGGVAWKKSVPIS